MNIFVQVRDHHHGVCGQQEPAPAAGGDSGQAAGARPAADGRQPRERGAGPLPRARRAAPGREARQRAGQQPGRLQARGLRLLRVRLGPQAGGGPQPGRHPGLPGILITDECPHNLTRPSLQAPEFLRGCAASAACDVYSLGVLLWQLETREVPFSGQHPQAVMYQVHTPMNNPMNT